MRKLLAPAAALSLAVFAFASVAIGHTGSVDASEDCQSFVVHVFLSNNVTDNRTVTVTTTIPGTTGISDGHYDTTHNPGDIEILTLSGPAPASGTVTLTISDDEGDQFTDSASVSPAEDCGPPPQPGIEIRKSSDAEGSVVPGTAVTYTYEVENIGGLPLTDVVVKDQLAGNDNIACEVDSSTFSGDDGNGILDPGETWTFTCTTALQVTTQNEACVSALIVDEVVGGDQQPTVVEDCDDEEVEVSASPEQSIEAGTGSPSGSIPNTSLDGTGPSPLPTILFSVVLLASLGSLAYTNVKVVARRKR